MAMLKLYKSSMQSIQFVTPLGSTVEFIQGRFATDNQDIINALDTEIRGRHPHIYRDKNELEVDSEKMDPIEEIKRKAVADYIAAQLVSNDKGNDRGNYTPGATVMTNSFDIAAASAAPESAPQPGVLGTIAARLAAAKLASATAAAETPAVETPVVPE